MTNEYNVLDIKIIFERLDNKEITNKQKTIIFNLMSRFTVKDLMIYPTRNQAWIILNLQYQNVKVLEDLTSMIQDYLKEFESSNKNSKCLWNIIKDSIKLVD